MRNHCGSRVFEPSAGASGLEPRRPCPAFPRRRRLGAALLFAAAAPWLVPGCAHGPDPETGTRGDPEKLPQAVCLAIDAEGKATFFPGGFDPNGRDEGGKGETVERAEIPPILAAACRRAPLFLAARGPDLETYRTVLPILVHLRRRRDPDRFEIFRHGEPPSAGEAGIAAVAGEIHPLLSACPDLLVDVDPGTDVPMKWVLAAVHSIRKAGARRIEILGFALEEEETSWFRDAPGFWRMPDDGIWLPDVSLRMILDGRVTFRGLWPFIPMCAHMGIVRVALREPSGEWVDMSLPADRYLYSGRSAEEATPEESERDVFDHEGK
jgi:hypothetical protein